jgi:amino acid transporter
LSIGIGAIIGGGFFATFGLAVVGAQGSTYLSFLLGGVLALLTAYSYVRLTLHYAEPGGTVAFVRRGVRPFAAARMPQCSADLQLHRDHGDLCASAGSLFRVLCRAWTTRVLAPRLCIERDHFARHHKFGRHLAGEIRGCLQYRQTWSPLSVHRVWPSVGHPDWHRLGRADWWERRRLFRVGLWCSWPTKGFELIANASNRIKNPRWTLPIAYYGSIVVYVLAIIVAIGRMPFEAIINADFLGRRSCRSGLGSRMHSGGPHLVMRTRRIRLKLAWQDRRC